MQTQYSLAVPGNVICGVGCVKRLPDIIQLKGTERLSVLVDVGVLKSGKIDTLLQTLRDRFSHVALVTDVPPEPEEGQVRVIFDQVQDSGAQCVVAIGGGSVMDTSKIIAVMLQNPGYYTDLTDTAQIACPGVPLIAVPTSAGTGSEATPNAIILIPEKKQKVGVIHSYFLPQAVLLDAELTCSLPPTVTAATGLDAFCHCIETYISRKTNPFSRLFGLRGMELVQRYLRRAYTDGNDMEARENMLLAAFYGGVAITASSTVAVHALSYPLGGFYRIPHGISNAVLLPYVMSYNIDSISDCVPALAQALGLPAQDGGKGQGQQVIEALFSLCADVHIPNNLRMFNIHEKDLEFLTVSASRVHRLLDQNPKVMSLEDIRSIYAQLL